MHHSSKSENANSIRQRMETVRCEMDEGVQEIVEDVRSYFDWRTYVRKSPWLCLSAAFAAGYLVVPKKRLVKSAIPVQMQLAPASQPSSSVDGKPGGRLLTFVSNLALRGISAYVESQAGKFFETLAAQSPTVYPDEDSHCKSTSGSEPFSDRL